MQVLLLEASTEHAAALGLPRYLLRRPTPTHQLNCHPALLRRWCCGCVRRLRHQFDPPFFAYFHQRRHHSAMLRGLHRCSGHHADSSFLAHFISFGAVVHAVRSAYATPHARTVLPHRAAPPCCPTVLPHRTDLGFVHAAPMLRARCMCAGL